MLSRHLAALGIAVLSPLAYGQNLSSAIEGLPTAGLYQANGQALEARLALLDNTPADGIVKIATFVFDYGQAVKTLAGHMCKAAARGVHVELVVDAKSGDQPGRDDAFDAKEDFQAAEEIYQLLANCGVKVSVHNQDHGFVTVSLLGVRLPNIFPGVPNGGTVSPITAIRRVSDLKARLVNGLRPTLAELGVRRDPSEILDNLQSLAMGFAGVSGTGEAKKGSPEQLARSYRAIISDPFWDEMDVHRMRALSGAIEMLLKTDPDLRNVFLALRRHNRLNHRKIFLAQAPGGEGCAMIGGRNLGDHYLVNSKDNFRDGDVMVCSNQSGGLPLFMEIENSFNELTTDFADPVLGVNDNRVGDVRANPAFAFKHINPAEILNVKTLDKVPAAIALPNFDQPRLLRSKWQPSSDTVRMALLEAITREQKEIYIESAYAEFNGSIRRALEKALNRGVKVTVVTNSLFILDGPSKMIRLWMANWNLRMFQTYPTLFRTSYATEQAGHMIHIKTAGFRCQKGVNGNYRVYMIGSHNFHPRSGYSDKENTLQWREQTTASCTDYAGDLIDQRAAYWNIVQNGSKVPVLAHNVSLYRELKTASLLALEGRGDNANLARSLLLSVFMNDKLFKAERTQSILELIEDGGLRDLIGTLL